MSSEYCKNFPLVLALVSKERSFKSENPVVPELVFQIRVLLGRGKIGICGNLNKTLCKLRVKCLFSIAKISICYWVWFWKFKKFKKFKRIFLQHCFFYLSWYLVAPLVLFVLKWLLSLKGALKAHLLTFMKVKFLYLS